MSIKNPSHSHLMQTPRKGPERGGAWRGRSPSACPPTCSWGSRSHSSLWGAAAQIGGLVRGLGGAPPGQGGLRMPGSWAPAWEPSLVLPKPSSAFPGRIRWCRCSGPSGGGGLAPRKAGQPVSLQEAGQARPPGSVVVAEGTEASRLPHPCDRRQVTSPVGLASIQHRQLRPLPHPVPAFCYMFNLLRLFYRLGHEHISLHLLWAGKDCAFSNY